MSFLSKPYPFIYNTRRNLFIAVLLGVVIFVINYLINDPKSVSQYFTINRTSFALGFGSITLLAILLVFEGSSRFLFSETLKERWTLGKETLFIGALFALIILGNYAFMLASAIDPVPLITITAFLFIALNGILIGFLPAFIAVLINYTIVLKRNLEQAKDYNQLLQAKAAVSEVKEEKTNIQLTTNSTKEELSINLSELCFIKAEGNYVEVYSREQDGLKKELYRTTIQSLEEQFKAHPNIVRTHRSYLVNLKNISYTEGNARNFQLYFNSSEITVPVSRSKFLEIQSYLQSIRNK